MSPRLYLLPPLCAFALGALSTAEAQIIDLGPKESANLIIAWETSSPVPPGEGIEPEPSPGNETPGPSGAGEPVEPAELPGNVPVALTEQLAVVPEPPLPEPEDPEAMTPAETTGAEVSSIPRRFRYSISVEVRGVYDDNVTLTQEENRQEDFSAQITGGVILGIGDVLERDANYISFTYSPTAYFYVNNSEFNTLEHIAHLEARWRPGRFAFTLSQDFQSVQSTNLGVANEAGGFNNQANLDAGGRRRVTTYSTRFDAAADLSGKTALRFGASYYLSDPEDLIGTESLSGLLGFNYIYGPKLNGGVDFTLGKIFAEGASPDQTFEQLNVRASYELTGKISVNGSAGIEFRQSDETSDDQVSPIFQGGLTYKPFDGTSLGASATRRTLNSASAVGQDFTSTQITFNAQQRLLQRFYLSLSTGYQTQTYFSRATGVQADREDNYYFVVPGLDVRLTNFWFAGIYYVSRQNDSSLQFFSFDDNQIGFRSNLQF